MARTTNSKKKTSTTNTKKTQNSNTTKTQNSNTTRTKNSNTTRTKNQKANNSFTDEIIILLLLAFSILMLFSNLGMGGFVGDGISRLCFGIFGLLGYVLPFVLFFGVAFVYLNRKKPRIYIKLSASIVLWMSICTFIELLFTTKIGYPTLLTYYEYSSSTKRGGGIVGGFLVNIFEPSLGMAGTIIVLLLLCVISGILISERSFIKLLTALGIKAQSDMSVQKAKLDKKRAIMKEERQIQRELALKREQEEEQEQEKVRRNGNLITGVTFDTTLKKEENANTSFTTEVPEIKETFCQSDLFEEEKIVEKEEKEPVISIMEPKITRKRATKESKQQLEEETVSIENDINTAVQTSDNYVYPPLYLLSKGKENNKDSSLELRETAMKLQRILQSFGVNVQVTEYSKGPSVTRYELQPEKGVKVSRIVGLADDIKLNLAAADIRIEAPIPGKAAVGIEVPNLENSTVALRTLLESQEFKSHESNIAFAAGKDIGGKTIVTDIGKMPHVLIAGSTGSGKSVCINTIIMSILYKAKPDDVKLIMIDPKVVELSVYNGIPHLLIPVVTDPKKAAGALNWAVTEMTKRYQLFAEYNVRDLKGYNDKIKTIESIEDETKPEKMPQIIVIVDELADLMMVAPGDVEEAICRLAQLARAAGIHLILATQRPSVNVITGLIKANMPSRIAFAVSSGVDSRTIIDMNGAEKLLGKGDMLFYPTGYPKPVRVQGAFVSDAEVHKVVSYLIEHQGQAVYNQEIQNHVTSNASGVGANVSANGNSSSDGVDAYFVEAGKFIIEKDKASIGMLQRMYKIGFNRAARIMDQLSEAGVVGEEEGTKPRKVLMSMDEFDAYIDEYI